MAQETCSEAGDFGAVRAVLAYLGKRLLQMFPVLLIVTGFVFAMLWMMPGDPARAFVGPGEVLDEQQLEVIRK